MVARLRRIQQLCRGRGLARPPLRRRALLPRAPAALLRRARGAAEAEQRVAQVVDRGRRSRQRELRRQPEARGVASALCPSFGRCAFYCIEADFCNQILSLQQFSTFAHFVAAPSSKFSQTLQAL